MNDEIEPADTNALLNPFDICDIVCGHAMDVVLEGVDTQLLEKRRCVDVVSYQNILQLP